MEHNTLIDAMLHTITSERAITRVHLARDIHVKDRFILSGFNGKQLEAVKQYIASFRLNS